MNPARTLATSSALAIMLVLVLMALLFTFCQTASRFPFEPGRPSDAVLVGTARGIGTRSGISSDDRAFTSRFAFEDVLLSYETFVEAHGGTERSTGLFGSTFSLNDQCIFVSPWDRDSITTGNLRNKLSEKAIELLDRSTGSFVESQSDDCSYRG